MDMCVAWSITCLLKTWENWYQQKLKPHQFIKLNLIKNKFDLELSCYSQHIFLTSEYML